MVVNENEKLYEGVICETCIKAVIKSANERTCEMCGKHAERIIRLSIRSGYNGQGICSECEKKLPDKPDKEPNMICVRCHKNRGVEEFHHHLCRECGMKENHNEYLCEGCGKSCWKDKGDQGANYYRKRITHWYTDFRKTVNYFCIDGDYGNLNKKGDSKCAEEFKKEHFQTCSQCQKREWPDMAKGWMLDYELKMAFCKPDCHMAYRKLTWEQADQLTQIEMLPPELELSSGDKKDFDWEKEGLKREVLFWREYAKELEKKLANKSNLTPEERQKNDYLRRLQQNTLNSVESAYKNKYGSLSEDSPKSGKDKSSSKGLIIGLSIFGGIAVVGGVIFLLTRNRKYNKRIKKAK